MSISPFKNEAFIDFTKPENFEKQKNAIAEVKKKLGATYPLVIGGKEVTTERKLNSYSPSNTDELIAVFSKGDVDLANTAVDEALKAFETWRFVDPKERAALLFRAAEIAKRRRFEINAYMVLEAGKNFAEADGDTAEAIDFMEFYAREMLRYAETQPITPLPGEHNELVYIPLGVGVIIPPWNFPFAILAGMSSAAIVSGNTIVLKPSSDTPMMGRLYFEIMKEAGVPDGVLNFLPGSGGEVGDTLVAHPKVRFISFTGSMEVGIHIYELAAKVQPGQIWLKRVVAEMGGKDSIIVDADTDLDEAADGIVASAFGFQGQKCSACSRAIIDEKVYDTMVNKIKERVAKIEIGPAEDNFRLGPVASASAERGILKYIEIGKTESKLICGGEKAPGNGYYIQPTVFADVDPEARISLEEIFGPVLAVIKSPNFEESLKICNNTIYGLTGAVYTNDRAKLERAKKELLIGNLYLNRKCTGALVGAHPFGGFNMSGTDSKAGGRDYLLLFLQAKLMSEKIK